ncbi:MAG: hypothetical protein NZ735_01325 [Candidatus Marinimicrobia bacterium]|nr:hypothetical protein [Candidatus Neomarinimicrobiota bacterium]
MSYTLDYNQYHHRNNPGWDTGHFGQKARVETNGLEEKLFLAWV